MKSRGKEKAKAKVYIHCEQSYGRTNGTVMKRRSWDCWVFFIDWRNGKTLHRGRR